MHLHPCTVKSESRAGRLCSGACADPAPTCSHLWPPCRPLQLPGHAAVRGAAAARPRAPVWQLGLAQVQPRPQGARACLGIEVGKAKERQCTSMQTAGSKARPLGLRAMDRPSCLLVHLGHGSTLKVSPPPPPTTAAATERAGRIRDRGREHAGAAALPAACGRGRGRCRRRRQGAGRGAALHQVPAAGAGGRRQRHAARLRLLQPGAQPGVHRLEPDLALSRLETQPPSPTPTIALPLPHARPPQLLSYATPPQPLSDEDVGLAADYDQETFDR